MPKKKRPEVKREIQNPTGYLPGTVIEEFMDGSMTIHNPDGTQEFIDAQGKTLSKVTITDAQIEAWKKMPVEEATKRILELVNNTELDVADKRLILDSFKFLAEIHGALAPKSPQGTNIVAIRVNFINVSESQKENSQNNKSVDVEAKVVEQ